MICIPFLYVLLCDIAVQHRHIIDLYISKCMSERICKLISLTKQEERTVSQKALKIFTENTNLQYNTILWLKWFLHREVEDIIT